MGSQPGNKITALLLDCDNTLVQSETVAFEACADLTNEILAARNVDLHFTGHQLQREFVGQSFQAMMRSLEANYNVSCNISDTELEHYAGMEDDRVISKLVQKLQPCEGANAELERLVGLYRLAVVSSSALRRVRASLEKAGQAGFFDPSDVFSAADSLPVPTSKPDPAVYLHALKVLGKTADECVAVEDSRSGATSANQAGIVTIGYTGACDDPEEAKALRVVLEKAGCKLIMARWDEFPELLWKIESGLV
ncbi:HAD superfamily hydrolase [Colletotrichum tofieldiae]|uniref:HAD superfamily hydrolase n=1 Tax=Colletotrichum tofieldiae TaxID=708197 RepID=A0A166U835_9PEZI|nr:HAD superfamily hydrolase [Colletotrichum tofieldiae]GKT63337.1 HAD superfamily hydrolase [Colletotrichum tofieldiae]GKT72652.1 HAD superfamily hydrolase [Colletotrichum tofieldiae]GKT89508.1 HAD superfamily hydrolase [Colletotrichum tofieldiae]